uniref:Uncharacterized protein MANES_05G050200 n=1 Tax=Rhizophora mucronata TaxID=61149 RepID=A0A2P2MSE4_RHIMU
MKDTTPTSLLKDRKREIEGNPDFSNKDAGASQQQMVPEVKSGMIPPANHVELPLEYPASVHLPSGPLMEEEKLPALELSDQLAPAQVLFPPTPSQSPFSVPTPVPNIGSHVIINHKLSSWGLHLHFQRFQTVALSILS